MSNKTHHTHVPILLVLLGVVIAIPILHADMPINLLEPYDVLIIPFRPPNRDAVFGIGYEGAFHIRGFRGDDETGRVDHASLRGNPLQLWDKEQNAIAAFNGLTYLSRAGQLSQELFRDNNNNTHGIFTPCGTLTVPLNLLLSGRFRLPYELSLGIYIPYRVAQLTHVRWLQRNPDNSYEEMITPDLIPTLEQLGGMSLRGWTRHGFGDLMTRIEWFRGFQQARPWLQMVGLHLRAGLSIPTGLRQNSDILIGFPFGHDGGVGFQISGQLELGYCHGIVLSIDGSLLHMFGNTKERRIRTNTLQTDLFLITKAISFKEPGFTQRFTLYAEKVARNHGLSARVAYQYLKHSDDQLFICDDRFDHVIANTAEYLQEWTTHSLIFLVKYDACRHTNWDIIPSIHAFFKLGFNGKRAFVADSLGITWSISF